MAAWTWPTELATWIASMGGVLDPRCAGRLTVLVAGALWASGRRTVTTWLRAADVTVAYQSFYYFLSVLARARDLVAERLLLIALSHVVGQSARILLALDDTHTRRYGPKVQGAGVHRNPTPGPGRETYFYGHVWVTLSLVVRHALWGTIGLPLLARLYVRACDIAKIPRPTDQPPWPFATKLELGAGLVRWAAECLHRLGRQLWVVFDGGYTKRPFLKEARDWAVLVGRLRWDAALRDRPPVLPPNAPRPRGRPRIYGLNRIDLAKRAGQTRGWQDVAVHIYGREQTQQVKSFLATYRPVGGPVRVVLVREPAMTRGWVAYFSTNTEATAAAILEAVADRAAIEQDFHDLKEIHGAGQQQTRHIWASIGCYHLTLWLHTLIELWAWKRSHSQLCDRSASPWDAPDRRPSHADRRAALRRAVSRLTFSPRGRPSRSITKIRRLAQTLLRLVG